MNFGFKNSRRALTIALLACSAFGIHAQAQEKGQSFAKLNLNNKWFKSAQIPVCNDFLRVLNRPENSKVYAGINNDGERIRFPTSLKMFKPVTWQSISFEEAKNYFEPSYLDKLLEADKRFAVEKAKDWTTDSKFEFEIAVVDYDASPPDETIIRYRYRPKGRGTCLLSKDTPKYARDHFNGIMNGNGYFSSGSPSCDLFYYGNRIFRFDGSGINRAILFQPDHLAKWKVGSNGESVPDTDPGALEIAEQPFCYYDFLGAKK